MFVYRPLILKNLICNFLLATLQRRNNLKEIEVIIFFHLFLISMPSVFCKSMKMQRKLSWLKDHSV